MKLLSALIAVFMVSGAMAQDYDGNDVSFAQKKKPAGFSGSGVVTCDNYVRGAPSWSCKDPKTGKVVNIECKVPPKMAQKMPKKMSGAQLKELCPNWNQGESSILSSETSSACKNPP